MSARTDAADEDDPGIVIVGGGIGGLALALALHARGIGCTVLEAVAEVQPVGVGINVLPHAVKVLRSLGLEDELLANGIATAEHLFFTRHGQLVHGEARGRAAGYDVPQISIHRGHLHGVLRRAVLDRIGATRLLMGHRTVAVHQDAGSVAVRCVDPAGRALPPVRGRAAVGCDGVHSVLRRQIVPGETPPRYSGINMWRGVTVARPFLSGATMVHIGWYATGCMVIYPIRNEPDGRQLINWVAQVETPLHEGRDWNRRARPEDFIAPFAELVFPWIDVPALIRGADTVLEYPMVDQDPLDRWTEGRMTLLGDAAHPMYPRGSNGSGQAILDAMCLADELAAHDDPASAFQAYEAVRRPATTAVVLLNRAQPPDTVLRMVYERTGDAPFDRIEDVLPSGERERIMQRYKVGSGYDLASLRVPDTRVATMQD